MRDWAADFSSFSSEAPSLARRILDRGRQPFHDFTFVPSTGLPSAFHARKPPLSVRTSR
jgi:hypothetical protein